MDLGFYFKLFLRRLHWFLLPLFICAAAGIALAVMLPPTYVARSVLVVESEQIPSELAETTVRTEATEALQIIEQRILTRDRLIDMARRLDIYAPAPGETRRQMSGDDVVRDLRERISIRVTGQTNSRAAAQATIVTVSFDAPNARLSAAVVNEIVTLMLDENVTIRTSVAGDTLDFFRAEVERLDTELTRRGADMLAFQEANLNALPDSLDFRRSQQAAAQERLLALEREEVMLRDRRARFIELYEATGQVQAPDPAQLTAEERQLQGLRDELTAALAVLTPQNPRIQMLQSRIDALEQQIAATAGTAVPDAGPRGPSAYDLQLADIDGQIRFLGEQKDQITTTLDALRASIQATPANAVQLETMQRDYDAVRAQYDQAVRNRATAETGDTIEALSKGQRISVIEPAVAPQSPESPNRPLIAAGGIGAGVALGLALVVLIEMTKSAVRRPADLNKGLGITPLITLPYIRTRQEAWRRRAIILGTFAVVLIGVPLGLYWIHSNVTPLDLLMNRALGRLGLAALNLPAALPLAAA